MTAKVRTFAVVGLILLLASGIWLYSWRGMERAEQNFERLLSSYEQLSAVRRLQVVFSLDLLGETMPERHPEDTDIDIAGAHANNPGEALLLELVDSVQAELALTESEKDRQQAVAELADLREVQESFNAISNIYRQSVNAGQRGGIGPAGGDILPSLRQFNAALQTFEQRELSEAREALQVIAHVPSRLGLLLSLTGAATMLALTVSLYRIWLQQTRLEQAVSARTRELEESAEALRVADQNRKLFFAKVGHELRTPLTVVLSEADTALQTEENHARQQQALANIRLQGSQLARRINDLLALSRSEAGELVLARAPCEVAPLIDHCCHVMKPYAELRGVSLTPVLSAESDLELVADAEWLGNAIAALIDNAIKVSSPGETVVIKISSVGSQVLIDILDRGPGIPEDSINGLLQPYRRMVKAEDYVGSGLGLATADWVIKQHGGCLLLANREGGGLRARLALAAS